MSSQTASCTDSRATPVQLVSYWMRPGGPRTPARTSLPPLKGLILQLCVSTVAGWVNRGQQRLIECVLEENRVVREPLGGTADYHYRTAA